MTQKQVAATKIVSRCRWNAFLSGKNRTNPTRGSTDWKLDKKPRPLPVRAFLTSGPDD
jgi:hypothetical protein